MERVQMIRPGFFSPLQAAADASRTEFDIKNECLLVKKTPIRFVFFGDSITQRWELNTFFQSEKGIFVNRGIGGDVAEFGARRFEADALQLRPQHVVLLIGVNDTFKLEASMLPSRKGWSIEEVVNLVIRNIVNMVQQAADYQQSLVLCSLLPTDLVRTEMRAERNRAIVEINKHLKTIASSAGCIFVDYHSSFVNHDGFTLRPDFSDDGIHPHSAGYTKMAEILRDTLLHAGVEI
ncbi:SGNH/GDSL hydrolase family protein [Paenibacillus caui]|uniref:SGNH/GDSL hydrolase family protein n=1 Tax=Paenibacillus caui TaxID=2873927 RepID=UPI001CA892F3|nr:GDSL-type esterase/lipase family protein [Paenibacillus caui]